MINEFIEDQDFKGIDFVSQPIPNGEYENCTFDQCIFANADLSGLNFVECRFINCDFTNAKIKNTAFRKVQFKVCKMLGLHFENCNKMLLSFSFNECNLNLSSFYQLQIKKTLFIKCSLHEVDFAETDLTSSTFDGCDFLGSIFENTLLVRANFLTSYNYLIDPELNRIKKAKFALSGIPGLLSKYDIEIE